MFLPFNFFMTVTLGRDGFSFSIGNEAFTSLKKYFSI